MPAPVIQSRSYFKKGERLVTKQGNTPILSETPSQDLKISYLKKNKEANSVISCWNFKFRSWKSAWKERTGPAFSFHVSLHQQIAGQAEVEDLTLNFRL